MSNNEINITLNISDQLLSKLIMAMKQDNNMGIPLQALMGMAMQPPPPSLPKDEKSQQKSTIGFKANGGAK